MTFERLVSVNEGRSLDKKNDMAENRKGGFLLLEFTNYGEFFKLNKFMNFGEFTKLKKFTNSKCLAGGLVCGRMGVIVRVLWGVLWRVLRGLI